MKLIDMGGVRPDRRSRRRHLRHQRLLRARGRRGADRLGPVHRGRTLAVLIMDFSSRASRVHAAAPAEQPVLAQNESLYRLLVRATHQDPIIRYQSADEMADQLLGVLREIVARKTTPRPAESAFFGGEVLVDVESEDERLTGPTYRLLPPLKLDATDPAASALLSAGTLSGAARKALFQRAGKMFPTPWKRSCGSPMTISRTARSPTPRYLGQVLSKDKFEWRVSWYTGRKLLAQGRVRSAAPR